MPPTRVWLVGHGTVGQWITRTLNAGADRLAERYGARFSVVGIATARDGFVYRETGLDLAAVTTLAAGGRPLGELAGTHHWPRAIDGIRATEADVLVEVTQSPAEDGEPGVTHLREALSRGIPTVTSNKWPVALHGVELARLAREHHVPFRAESTVMSGTPLLSTLTGGLAGATPLGVRGLLNATVNAILTDMAGGHSYAEALQRAQATGLAERDPEADVGGADTVAKVMVLAALVFGRQLTRDQVSCRGITDLTAAELADAAAGGGRLKHVATLEFTEPDGRGDVVASVRPEVLAADDPLASVEGATNALTCRAEPVGEITVVGPGAGTALAGQGVLSDLLNPAISGPDRERSPSRSAP